MSGVPLPNWIAGFQTSRFVWKGQNNPGKLDVLKPQSKLPVGGGPHVQTPPSCSMFLDFPIVG